jgi:hypothetical protein
VCHQRFARIVGEEQSNVRGPSAPHTSR